MLVNAGTRKRRTSKRTRTTTRRAAQSNNAGGASTSQSSTSSRSSGSSRRSSSQSDSNSSGNSDSGTYSSDDGEESFNYRQVVERLAEQSDAVESEFLSDSDSSAQRRRKRVINVDEDDDDDDDDDDDAADDGVLPNSQFMEFDEDRKTRVGSAFQAALPRVLTPKERAREREALLRADQAIDDTADNNEPAVGHRGGTLLWSPTLLDHGTRRTDLAQLTTLFGSMSRAILVADCVRDTGVVIRSQFKANQFDKHATIQSLSAMISQPPANLSRPRWFQLNGNIFILVSLFVRK